MRGLKQIVRFNWPFYAAAIAAAFRVDNVDYRWNRGVLLEGGVSCAD